MRRQRILDKESRMIGERMEICTAGAISLLLTYGEERVRGISDVSLYRVILSSGKLV